MKILHDTNVLLSGFISQGFTFDVIKDAIFKHELYYTEYIFSCQVFFSHGGPLPVEIGTNVSSDLTAGSLQRVYVTMQRVVHVPSGGEQHLGWSTRLAMFISWRRAAFDIAPMLFCILDALGRL